jgi:hypothetical protein
MTDEFVFLGDLSGSGRFFFFYEKKVAKTEISYIRREKKKTGKKNTMAVSLFFLSLQWLKKRYINTQKEYFSW